MDSIDNKNIDHEKISKIYSTYKNINSFIERYNNIDFIKFNHNAIHDLSLFAIEPDLDFELIELYIDRINKTLPAIKNIFSKPLLHLKEESVIMPVEAVSHIDKYTIEHIGTHSEYWDDIHKNSIKPSKLLTRVYKDNYSIYENIIFCNLIDKILVFSKNNIRLLKELILTKQTIELNLLERVHHLQYFLALGKLYTGYIKFFDQFYDASLEDLNKISNIYNTINSRLNRPIYKYNLKRPRNIKLRKTNILSMHKEYRQIYKLMRFFDSKELKTTNEFSDIKYEELKKNYFNYCKLLILFSINHFNYEFIDSRIINFDDLNLNFNFKNWNLEISNHEIDKYNIIQLDIISDKNLKLVFIPIIEYMENREEVIQNIINKVNILIQADEYIICTPYEHDEYIDNECYLSISNVESFRRVQQIILKIMVNSDTQRYECPFCTNKLTINKESTEDNKVYVCKSCRTIITDAICPDTLKPYSSTNILNLKQDPLEIVDYSDEDKWLYYRKLESLMFYRNITKINNNMEVICPHCNKVHKYY